jgi:hypothetical protein
MVFNACDHRRRTIRIEGVSRFGSAAISAAI